jgi:hypothetical protein
MAILCREADAKHDNSGTPRKPRTTGKTLRTGARADSRTPVMAGPPSINRMSARVKSSAHRAVVSGAPLRRSGAAVRRGGSARRSGVAVRRGRAAPFSPRPCPCHAPSPEPRRESPAAEPAVRAAARHARHAQRLHAREPACPVVPARLPHPSPAVGSRRRIPPSSPAVVSRRGSRRRIPPQSPELHPLNQQTFLTPPASHTRILVDLQPSASPRRDVCHGLSGRTSRAARAARGLHAH